MVNKKEDVVCYKCSALIDVKKDKYVKISTMNIPNADDHHVFFHFNCYVQYIQDKVNEKVKNQIQLMQNKAVEIMDHPVISQVLQSVQGSEVLAMMLQTPLSSQNEIIIPKSIVEEKLKSKTKNGGRKTKTNSKKTASN